MIVPMKKVALIIKGDKKTETLKELRKLGILQIEIHEGSGEKLDKLKAKHIFACTSNFKVNKHVFKFFAISHHLLHNY